MIEILAMGGDKVIGIRIKGRVESADFETVTGVIEEKFGGQDRVRIYVEIEDFGGMSLPVFLKDLRFSLKHYKQFEREAVVSDKAWLKTFVTVTDKLFPSIEAKHFSFADKEKALSWITDEPKGME
jgi:hypothetical protein